MLLVAHTATARARAFLICARYACSIFHDILCICYMSDDIYRKDPKSFESWEEEEYSPGESQLPVGSYQYKKV